MGRSLLRLPAQERLVLTLIVCSGEVGLVQGMSDGHVNAAGNVVVISGV